MPRLDVSRVLTSPWFQTTFTVYRSLKSVDPSNGRTTLTTTGTDIRGVVTQGAGDVLDRLGDAQKIKGAITVHSKFILAAGGGGIDADEIVWQGRRYVVEITSDYSIYGAGFSAAVCSLQALNA